MFSIGLNEISIRIKESIITFLKYFFIDKDKNLKRNVEFST